MNPFPSPVMEDDNREKEATELIQNLALKGESLFGIREQLQRKELANQLPQSDVERIYHQARAGRAMSSGYVDIRPARVVGILAILVGLGWMGLTHSWSRNGMVAVLLGTILVVKPHWGDVPTK